MPVCTEFYFKLEIIAAKRGCHVSDLIDVAIADYLSTPAIQTELEKIAKELAVA
jgi:predicted DNA-binding ribbon-helix-helix protein